MNDFNKPDPYAPRPDPYARKDTNPGRNQRQSNALLYVFIAVVLGIVLALKF